MEDAVLHAVSPTTSNPVTVPPACLIVISADARHRERMTRKREILPGAKRDAARRCMRGLRAQRADGHDLRQHGQRRHDRDRRSPQSETAGEPLRWRRPDHAAQESVIGR